MSGGGGGKPNKSILGDIHLMRERREFHSRLKDIKDLDDRDLWRTGFNDGFRACSTEMAPLIETLEEKQYLIGVMDAALVRQGINFDFHKALEKYKKPGTE